MRGFHCARASGPQFVCLEHLHLIHSPSSPLALKKSGGTPQPNPWTQPESGTKEWIDFFSDYRIAHQLKLAGDSYCSDLWYNDIAPRLHLLFEDLTGEKEIRPSLLHGDLWSGNIGSADGKPSIFDPAAYWGHHEAEWGVSCCSDLTPSLIFCISLMCIFALPSPPFSCDRCRGARILDLDFGKATDRSSPKTRVSFVENRCTMHITR